MPLEYTCPDCGHRYQQISRHMAGKRVRCRCGKTGRLPDVHLAKRKKSVSDAPDRLLIDDDFSDLDHLLNDD